MKNRDRDDEHRRRRSAGEDEDTPDGKELAKLLFGAGESDEPPDESDDIDLKEDLDDLLGHDLPDLSDLSDERFCELVEKEILDRYEGMSNAEGRRFAEQFRSNLQTLLNE